MLRHANKLIILDKLVPMTPPISYALQFITDIQDALYLDWISMHVLVLFENLVNLQQVVYHLQQYPAIVIKFQMLIT